MNVGLSVVNDWFDNFLIRDKGFRSDGAHVDPAQGIAFKANGSDIRLNHLICPGGLMPWDKGSFVAETDGDTVSVSFTWKMVRFSQMFRLTPVQPDKPFFIEEI